MTQQTLLLIGWTETWYLDLVTKTPDNQNEMMTGCNDDGSTNDGYLDKWSQGCKPDTTHWFYYHQHLVATVLHLKTNPEIQILYAR